MHDVDLLGGNEEDERNPENVCWTAVNTITS